MVATEFIDLKQAQDVLSGSGSSIVWQNTAEEHFTIPSNATNLILHFHTTTNVTFQFVTSHDGSDWHPIDQEHTHDSNTIVRLSNDTGHVMQYVGWRVVSGTAPTSVKLYFGRKK